MTNKINIRQYFEKGTFVIPDYQRGYKWSVSHGSKSSSTQFFIDSLIQAYYDNLEEYFIEALTVVEDNGAIILVDGQQRTTTLCLLFWVLEKDYASRLKLNYQVRYDSHLWLENLLRKNNLEILEEDSQDIYYFKKAIEQIEELVKDLDKAGFLTFILDHVFLLYNKIPKDKAVSTFIALNGLKAKMKDEELIKSDLLIKSSRISYVGESNEAEKYSLEWKINEDRSRLARNWDKWLYWWNQPKIRAYFGIAATQNPLFYLLVTYWNINLSGEKLKTFSFDNFKAKFINSAKNAKLHIEGIRKLQKTFEDLFYDYHSHNFLGLVLKTSSSKEEALHYFLNPAQDNKYELESYAKWSLIGSTHLEIINSTLEKQSTEDGNSIGIPVSHRKFYDILNLINERFVYWDETDVDFKDERKEMTFRFLLLLNLLEDNTLKRNFDFKIWDNRSLEHIYPKSKKASLDFEREEFKAGSVHCIGNLVLLYGRDNSVFGAKDFNEKKHAYFSSSEEFKSRNLLHTIYAFASSEWKEKEIIENKTATIKKIKNYYGL